jgi:hypothetical protein
MLATVDGQLQIEQCEVYGNSQVRSTVGKNSDSSGCINEQRSDFGSVMNRTAIKASAIK